MSHCQHWMAIILSLKDSDSYLSIQSNRLPHGCDEQPELKVNYNLLYVLVTNNENDPIAPSMVSIVAMAVHDGTHSPTPSSDLFSSKF